MSCGFVNDTSEIVHKIALGSLAMMNKIVYTLMLVL